MSSESFRVRVVSCSEKEYEPLKADDLIGTSPTDLSLSDFEDFEVLGEGTFSFEKEPLVGSYKTKQTLDFDFSISLPDDGNILFLIIDETELFEGLELNTIRIGTTNGDTPITCCVPDSSLVVPEIDPSEASVSIFYEELRININF